MNNEETSDKTEKDVPSISKYFSSSNAGTIFDEITSITEKPHQFVGSSHNVANSQRPASIFDQSPSPLNEYSMKDLSASGLMNSPDMPVFANMNVEASGVGGEADRRREAWPCRDVKEDIQLTLPGVTIQDDLSDPVQELVAQLLEGENLQRNLLTHADVTQDERGIRDLIQAGCYRAAVNLTSRLLTIYGQGYGRLGQPAKHSPHSLQLWFTRISLLAKLRLYTVCKPEADAFGLLDRRDVFYQYYPEMYGNRTGSMASFSFRLLIAELPSHWQKPKESLERLHKVLAVVRKIIRNLNNNLNEYGLATPVLTNEDRQESVRLWCTREAKTMHSIINSALLLKDFSLATQTLSILTKSSHWGASHRRSLHSAWGRILLQLGDILGAEKQFSISRSLRNDPNSPPDLREIIDRGLVAVAQNTFQEAFTTFQKALALDPSNVMVLNNMGTCLLYSGKVKEAISLLEQAISANPSRGLNESLLLNLCTLYELESSHSRAKKLALLRQINNFKSDMTGPVQVCLKLPV